MDFSQDCQYLMSLEDDDGHRYDPKTIMHSKIIANLIHEKIKHLDIITFDINPAGKGDIDIHIDLKSGKSLLLNTLERNLSSSYFGDSKINLEDSVSGYMKNYEDMDKITNWLIG